MRNFQGFLFTWTQTYREIFKSGLVNLKIVKLILTVTATKAVRERLCSMLHRYKFYLRSFITQELLSSCLIFATYKEEVDKIKLVANQFCSKSILFWKRTSVFHLKTDTSPESLPKVLAPEGTQT